MEYKMRGVGQTQNLIDNLPHERSIVVSPNKSISREIQHRAEDQYGKDFVKKIKFISVEDTEDLTKLMGFSGPIFFDHSFFLENEDLVKKALEIAHGCAVVYQVRKLK